MEWIEWLLSPGFRQFVFDHDLFIPLLFMARAIVVTVLELMMPAREVPYRSILLMDVVGAALVGYLLLPAALHMSEWIVIRPALPECISALPTAAAFAYITWLATSALTGYIDFYILGRFGESTSGTILRRTCTGWPDTGPRFYNRYCSTCHG